MFVCEPEEDGDTTGDDTTGGDTTTTTTGDWASGGEVGDPEESGAATVPPDLGVVPAEPVVFDAWWWLP